MIALVWITGCSSVGQTEPDESVTNLPDSGREVGLPEVVDPKEALWDSYMYAYPEATRPDVELIRYVTPSEAAGIKAQCLNEEGFPDARATADGQLQSGVVPPSQDEAYWIASYICAVRYQIDPQFTQPLDPARLSTLYAYYVNELSACLSTEGYDVADPPSETLFIESFFEDAWNPYLSVPDVSQSEWERLNAACPQWPSGFYGF